LQENPLHLTAIGLRLVYTSIVVSIVTQLSMICFRVIQASAIIAGLTALWFVTIAIGFIGQLLCVSTPNSLRGKGFLWASFVVTGLAVIAPAILSLLLPNLLFTSPLSDEFSINALTLWGLGIAVLGSIGSHVLFLLFLKSLASHLARSDLAQRATRVLRLIGQIALCCVALGAVIWALMNIGLFASIFDDSSSIGLQRELRLFAVAIPGLGGLVLLMLSANQFFNYVGLIGELFPAAQAFRPAASSSP
jgi:hypothetical protein